MSSLSFEDNLELTCIAGLINYRGFSRFCGKKSPTESLSAMSPMVERTLTPLRKTLS